MKVTRKKVKVIQCKLCPNVYEMVGDTMIGLSFPRPVTVDENGEPMMGICPAHRKKIEE